MISLQANSYLDKPYQRLRCRNTEFPPLRRCCRGCRAPESSPGPSTCRHCTPRTPCHDQSHSCIAYPHPWDTRCRVHTSLWFHSGSSHSCTRRWRRLSPCRAPSCGAGHRDRCMTCRADTSLCDWSFLRTSHLERGESHWICVLSSKWIVSSLWNNCISSFVIFLK